MTAFSSNVDITLDEPVDLPTDYIEKHRFLSSKDRLIHILFRNVKVFSTIVPKGIFNPYKGVAAHKLIELVLTNDVQVENKRIVDLGCGSGVIGLACIHQGARSVLFTDINPAVTKISDHPYLRVSDQVKVQNLLDQEKDASFDIIVVSTPTNVIPNNKSIDFHSYEGSIFRTDQFLYDLIAESARCLVPGGLLAMWVKLPTLAPFSSKKVFPNNELPMELARYFELKTMKIFWHALESEVDVGKQEDTAERSHLVFAVQKTS